MASRNRIAPILFLLLFMAVGLVPLVMGIREVQRARESLSWPTVEGRIVRSGVRSEQRTSRDDNGNQRTTTYYYADLSYDYAVDGRPLTGTRLTLSEGQSGSEADAKTTAERYPVDATVDVAYDPNAPDQSVLEPGKWGGATFLLIFGGVFVGVPGLMLWGVIRGSKATSEDKQAKEKIEACTLHGTVFKERVLEWEPGSRVHLHRDHETLITIVVGSVVCGLIFGIFVGLIPAGIFFFSRFGIMFVVKAYLVASATITVVFGTWFGIEHRRRDTVIDWGFHTVRAQVGWHARQYAFNQIESLTYRSPPKASSNDVDGKRTARIELMLAGRRYILLEAEVTCQQAAFLRYRLLPILDALSEHLGVPWSEQELKPLFARTDAASRSYTGEDRELVEAIKKVNGRVVHRDNQVEEVDLSEIKGTNGIVEIVSQIASLQRLHIKGKGITDEAVRYLRRLSDLRTLDLENTSLTDDGVGSLRDLEQLECLSLKGTRISSAALRRIADLPALEELDLAYTAIDDQALLYLSECESLDHLDLTGTKVTPLAIDKLQQQLPKCSIVVNQRDADK